MLNEINPEAFHQFIPHIQKTVLETVLGNEKGDLVDRIMRAVSSGTLVTSQVYAIHLHQLTLLFLFTTHAPTTTLTPAYDIRNENTRILGASQ